MKLINFFYLSISFSLIVAQYDELNLDIDNDINFPPEMTVCFRDDPKVNECIKNTVNNLLPALNNGSKPLNLRPLDPYVIETFDFKYAQGDLNFSMTVTNISMTGFSSMKVKATRLKFKNNYHDMKLELSCLMPLITMETLYEGGGKFMETNFDSKGYFNVTMTDISVIWKLFGEMEGDYMVIKKVDANPRTKNMKVFATGILPDPDINQLAVDFINTYWDEVYVQFFMQTRPTWEPFLVDIVNKFFAKIPFQQLLPPL